MGAVRPDVIVVVSPERRHAARLRQAVEGVLYQALVALPPVEALGESLLLWRQR